MCIRFVGPIVRNKGKKAFNIQKLHNVLDIFPKRHNIAFKAILGKATSINPEDVTTLSCHDWWNMISDEIFLTLTKHGYFFELYRTKLLTVKRKNV